MTTLTIVADFTIANDKIEFVKTELLKLVEKTRAEEGCINYDLHQDNVNPAHFMFYENWESYDLWQKHMESQHIADYKAATAGCVDAVTVSEMTAVDLA